LSTIVGATEILVLHHGEVRERGTHAGLRAMRGLYDRLYRLQAGEVSERRDAAFGVVEASSTALASPPGGG
jgi:ATP-binding cassette subfamily B protein